MPKTKSPSSSAVPTPTPVRIASGYVPEGTKPKFLAWEWVTERLEKSRNYWICTTRRDGRPHAVPVWGVFVDGVVVFSTDPRSLKARNIHRSPTITVHLESGDEVVIVEGLAELIKLTSSIDDAYNMKYKMRLSDFPGGATIYGVKPKVVLAWTEKEFVTNGTRWEFE